MRLVATLAACLFATSLQAASFNFAESTRGWADSHTFTSDGVTVRTTSGQASADHDVSLGGSMAPWRHYGLAVAGAGDTGQTDGSQQLDSYGASDVIIFDFDRKVSLRAMSFVFADWWDRFDIYIGDDLAYWQTLKVDSFMGGGMFGQSTVFLDAQVTRFAIGAASYESCGYSLTKGQACWTENSAFQITRLMVEPVAVVPLPLPGMMLGGAFAGLLGWRLLGFGRRSDSDLV